MTKRAVAVALALLAVMAGAYGLFMHTGPGQDFLLSRAVTVAAGRGDASADSADALRVFVCGSAAPAPTRGRAQSCLAVVTPEHYFIVDAGEGAANNLALANLPGERLDGILLTHFHSDHITGIPGINLGSWAAGRNAPLVVHGPVGVDRVVGGLNGALALDRKYRARHHGEDFMPEAVGRLEPASLPRDAAMEFGELKISWFPVDHSPVDPAVGYRFDYRGRSVVVSGDTLVTEGLRDAIAGADLLFCDALSLPIVETMERAARAQGRDRGAKILQDIKDYHASVRDVAALARSSNVAMIALYHLVPGPRNALMENVFRREFTDDMVLTRDRMWFELPAATDGIRVVAP